MHVTVVIPTYHRGTKLALTLDRLLASDTDGMEVVEIIVVDDGSPVPVAPHLAARSVSAPFTLRSIRQSNSGPAAARNTGFRAAHGDIVIFIDDDILVPPSLVGAHARAHGDRSRSVIYGRWVFAPALVATPLFELMIANHRDGAEGTTDDYVPVTVVASGHLSVERTMFVDDEGVYRSDLATPAAEEFELAVRLQARGIPVYLARRIVAEHNQEVNLPSICQQEYKHGVGIAEAAVKCPATLGLRQFASALAANRPMRRGDALTTICKKGIKSLLIFNSSRVGLLAVVRFVESVAPQSTLLRRLYTASIGAFFFAGIRAGLRDFSRTRGLA